jgi:hypothetical protein
LALQIQSTSPARSLVAVAPAGTRDSRGAGVPWGFVSRPKRHHFVPRSYLARFSQDGRVLVRWRGRSGLIKTGVQNVAVESGFYEVEQPSGEKSVAVEALLSKMEGSAATVLRSIDEAAALPDAGTHEREMLAVFLAVQLTRTPEQRDRVLFPKHVADSAGGREIDAVVVAEYLERVHLGFPPDAAEVRAALDFVQIALRDPSFLTKEYAIQLMLNGVDQFVPVLLDLGWALEIARKPQLLTSDLPLVIWRKPSRRDRYEGVGIANAEEIRFPLDPGKQLVLTSSEAPPVQRIEPSRVRSCNADIASACHRFIVGHPHSTKRLQEVPLVRKRPVSRFNTGPLHETMPDGSTSYRGEVLHMWVPRR